MKKSYIYADGQILAQYDGDPRAAPPAAIYFYLHDRLGSVRQVIDDTAAVVNHYTYEPYGRTLDSAETVTNPWRFTGQYYDAEIEEYHLRARQYNPFLARFTARDPVFGDYEEPLTLHKYLYCLNDPINKRDPDGRFAWLAARLFVGAVYGAISSGYGSDWNAKAMSLGAAAGAVSAILPAKFSSVILGAGLSSLSSSYANYQKTGDSRLASYSGLTAFAGGALAGGLSFGLGLRFNLDASTNVRESAGLISFILGESAGALHSSYLYAPACRLPELEEKMKQQRQDLQKLGFE